MKLPDRKSVYLGALLHDIGKFIERGKLPEWKERAEKYIQNGEASRNYAHRRFSAAFVDYLISLDKDFVDRSVESLVLLHHKGDDPQKQDYSVSDNKGIKLQIIRKADHCASSERRENIDKEGLDYYLAKMISPFYNISLNERGIPENEENIYLGTTSLTSERESMFPEAGAESNENKYVKSVKSFVEEVKNIDDEDGLLNLMEKYLTNVPAQTPFVIKDKEYLYKPDISLYDHLRIAGAIAVSLWDEYEKGSWKGKDKEILNNEFNELDTPCILINGNFSGIQDFIFNITSEKAARKLKARSYFIQMFSEVILKYLSDSFDLTQSNILYNGGGNMFILLPSYKKSEIDACYKRILESVRKTGLFFAVGVTDVKLDDFKNFGTAFSNATKEADKSKKKKFKGFDYKTIFEPEKQILNKDNKYEKLAEQLMLINDYGIFKINKEKPEKEEMYQVPFYELGYRIEIHDKKEGIGSECLLLNNTNFANDYKGFRFAVVNIPKWSKNELNEFKKELSDISEKKLEEIIEDNIDGIRTFKSYSLQAWKETGTQKLGVLKLDVDNLGRIFSEGIAKEDRTISRIASISRNIKWFFESYMNTLLGLPEYKDKLYPIFSGGDDFFIVGAWNKIFEFAKKINKEFRAFVSNNAAITLSASVLVIDENYPVSRFADIAEKRLHKAKEESENKNSISVFDAVISWNDFAKVNKLKDIIIKLINEYDVGRALIEKIRKSTTGFSKLQLNALNGKIDLNKVWRFSYYLRDSLKPSKDSKKNDAAKIIKEEIINYYERLLIDALEEKSTEIKIFPIAARWAELLTRKINKRKD